MTKSTPIHQLILRFLPVTILVAVLALVTGSVSSCNEPVAGDSTVVSEHGNASREELLAIIEGGWVNADYQEALLRVHSPMFAAEAGRPVQEMMFNTANMKGDTMLNESGRLNYLEGERFDVVLFSEGEQMRMKIWQGAAYADKPLYLDYRIDETAGDTTLFLVNPAGDTTWYHREFRKAPVKAGVAHNALEHYVNRALFAGEWKAQDGSTVKFTADGNVTGWAKWTWFSVEIDKYGTEIQPDVMSAYNDKMGATYVYTLDNDRLSIYEYDSNSEDGMWTRGKLVAEFERKK